MSQRSPLGGQLARAEFYGFDSDGNRIKLAPSELIGYTIRPVKETPRHALSGGETDIESEARQEGYRQRVIAELSPLELEVFRLQGKLTAFVEQRIRIPAGQIAEYIRGGYTLIPGSEETEQRAELPDIATVEVIGRVPLQHEQLSFVEIAERIGVTVGYARNLVYRANRKLAKLSSKGV